MTVSHLDRLFYFSAGKVQSHPKPEFSSLFFYCTYCLDKTETSEPIGGTIEDTYKHWSSTHLTEVPSKPFQFSVAETAVCHQGDAVGTFRELLKHQQQTHPNEPFAIVCHNDGKRCAICWKTSKSMVDHFQSQHQKLLRRDIFNAMQLSDAKLCDLLQIDIYKRRQCGHCKNVFETEEAIEAHHAAEHNSKEQSFKPYTGNEDAYLICDYCHMKFNRDEYFEHFKSHPYIFKCWKCLYQSTDLSDLVLHDKYEHELETLDYHCSMFPDWIRSHFAESKMVFPNGLVARNYNLIGTKFDDSNVFEMLVHGLVELTKIKFALLVDVKESSVKTETDSDGKETKDPPPEILEDPDFLMTELQKQNAFANNLLILKLPRKMDMDLRDMFLKLCEKLQLNVTDDDIQEICRRSRNGNDDVMVSLKSYELKEKIRTTSQKLGVFSGELFELNSDQWNKRIKILSHTTRYYTDMLTIAKEARSDRVIYHYDLTKRGLLIKRSASSNDRIFLSKTELRNYINRCRQKP